MSDDKKSWPELVGKTAEEAKQILLEEDPDLRIEIRTGKDLTQVRMKNRVQLFVDNNNIVVEIPKRG